jgi:transcriptional regulator with XRE-family HTH domain
MPQLLNLGGQPHVLLTQAEYERLLAHAREAPEPPLPEADAKGNCPALPFVDAVIARKIVRGRRALGLTQVELARRAGIRPETLNRLEQGKHMPTIATIDKIDRALKAAGETVEPPALGPFPHERWLYDSPQDSARNGQEVPAALEAQPTKPRRKTKKQT